MRIKLLLAACLAFSAAVAGTPEQDAIAMAKARVAHDMKDPDSAKFRDVRAALRGDSYMVCGEVNAKNSYGAYAGYRAFLQWGESTMVASDSGFADIDQVKIDTISGLCTSVLGSDETLPAHNTPTQPPISELDPSKRCDACQKVDLP